MDVITITLFNFQPASMPFDVHGAALNVVSPVGLGFVDTGSSAVKTGDGMTYGIFFYGDDDMIIYCSCHINNPGCTLISHSIPLAKGKDKL